MPATTVRPATAADVEALVRLRLANARTHVALEPAVYRVPDPEAVRQHFSATSARDAILVAELDGHVAGMVEIVPNPAPPDHQILQPRLSAQVHTVVTAESRGRGIGATLLEAARQWAAEHGITYLTAGIHHANAAALRFYQRHGYTDNGISLKLTV